MVELEKAAVFLQEKCLHDFIVHDQSVRVPPPAPHSDVAALKVVEAARGFRVKIWGGAKPSATVNLGTGTIDFTIGWICERWCSTYLLLKSMVIVPAREEPLITILPREFEFAWPDLIPPPWTKGDALVRRANEVFSWVALPTILHEVGHIVEANSFRLRRELELRCDEIAALHLLGKRKDAYADISMLGLAIWHCCLCSEDRVRKETADSEYPSPVERLGGYLNGFVSTEAELGSRIWLLGVSHVMRLTVERAKDTLGARDKLDAVLSSFHGSLDDMLQDLGAFWH